DARSGMVKLAPDLQAKLISGAPETFRPAAGAWGRSGSTLVLLASAKVSTLAPVLRQAWENARVPQLRKKKPLR
ncbi:MAG TPA: hypothetical protein VGL24_04440, partial [Chthoniobacterales bacterium]